MGRSFSVWGFLFATLVAVSAVWGETKPEMLCNLGIVEDVVSLAALPDGGAVVLTGDNRLLKADSKGAKVEIPLPPMAGEDRKARFSDLAFQAEKLVLCRFQEPFLYSLDLGKPDSWKITKIGNLIDQRKNPMFFRIVAAPERIRLLAGDSGIWEVNPEGKCRQLSPGSTFLAEPTADELKLESNVSPEGLRSWNILWKKSRIHLDHDSPLGNLIRLDPIGTGKDGEPVFLGISGTGDHSHVIRVFTLAGEKVGKTLPLPGIGDLSAVNCHVLLAGGEIGFLRLDQKTGQLLLFKQKIE